MTQLIQYTPCRHQNDNKGVLRKFYIHNFDNLYEMGQFHKNTNYHTQHEIDHLNCPITVKEIEFVILKLYKNKTAGSRIY